MLDRLSTNLKPKELINFTADLEIKYGRNGKDVGNLGPVILIFYYVIN